MSRRKPIRHDYLARPGARGWFGPGRGLAATMGPMQEWRGSTSQVCGLWPFSVGSGSPMVGVPMGTHLDTGATVCTDPISWFTENLINNPSVFILGLPGLGKSSVSRRMVTGLEAFGTVPFILGDLKPDYVDLVEELGGQVISIGAGRGHINVLDPGDVSEAAARMRTAIEALIEQGRELEDRMRLSVGDERQRLAAQLDEMGGEVTRLERIYDALLEDAHGRKTTMVSALLTIQRQSRLADWEETAVDQAIRVLEAREGVPTLADLLAVVQEAPQELREVVLDGGDMARYRQSTRQLEQSLIGLVRGGRLGTVFAHHTSQRQRRDAPVVYDVSALMDSTGDLQGAVLMACWSAGFATINAAHALADAGLEPPRNYLVVMDELHRALRSGPGMVERIDSLTRLNRNEGVGQIMITHTMNDLLALPTPEDTKKAIGLVERSGYVILGGLSAGEMPLLSQAIRPSKKEQELLVSWTSPAPYNPRTNEKGTPPGRGRFLIKVGISPGVPFKLVLTPQEAAVNDTNKRWHHSSRIARVEREDAA